MSNVTQAIRSIFSNNESKGTQIVSSQFAPGQNPVVGGIDVVTRLKTYNEQPIHAIIDDSGSMSGAKSLETSKAVTALLAELAEPKNKDGFRVNLISFGSSSEMVSTSAAPETISFAFSGSRGGTNAVPALMLAQNAEKTFIPRPDRRRVPGMVVFMSDGQLSDTEEAIRVANDMKEFGITIITIGFGADADIATLKTIATRPSSPGFEAPRNTRNTRITHDD